MLGLPIPVRDDLADYASYIAHRRRHDTRSLLTGATLSVSKAYEHYVSARGNTGILTPMTAVLPLKRALVANYDLLESGRPMSIVRSQLMASPRDGLCPMCGRGRVSTLDHFLPKHRYPEFAAYAKNLVPACYECNNLKGNKFGTTAETQFLHAYFDALPDEEILKTTITVHQAVFVNFSVKRSPSLSKKMYAKVRNHFETLKLAYHYEREANGDLFDRFDALSDYYGGAGDAAAVKDYLRREAVSYRKARGRNHWRSSLYLALCRNKSFCEGGFLLLQNH